jgi:ADP-ribose pyrophosphatase YjhB (NUDIX family)
MERLEIINPRKVTTEESLEYKLREAVRAVVFDQDKRIAILDVTRDNYFKLPGGGVEDGEDFTNALRRECLEEIGCDVETIGQIGYTEEYWKEDLEKQVSYCYIANVLGEKGLPALTSDEEEREATPPCGCL